MTAERRRVRLQTPQCRGDVFPALGVVDHGECVGDRPDSTILELSCLLGDGLTTPRAVVVMGRERFLAEATTRPLGTWARIVVFEDAGGGEDIAVVLVGSDVLVRAPHPRVHGPGHAVLDLTAAIPLSDHARDRRVAEVVRVDRFLDARGLGSAAELGADGRPGQRAVTGGGVVAVARQLVEKGDVGVAGSGMDLLAVGPEDGPAVDDRVLADRCALQRLRVRVGCIGRLVAVEIDVAHAERRDQRQARTRVGEELDQGDVSEIVRAVGQRGDVVGLEHVLGPDLVLGRADEVVVVGPLGDVEIREQLSDRELLVPDRAVRESVALRPGLAAEMVGQLIHVALAQRTEWAVEFLGGRSEVAEIGHQRGVSDLSVDFLDPALDERAIVGMVLIETVEFVAELLFEALDVLKIRHTPDKETGYQKTASSENRLFGPHDLPIAGRFTGQNGRKQHLPRDTVASTIKPQGSGGVNGGVSA